MNSRVKALLLALIVVACFGTTTTSALAAAVGVGSDPNVEYERDKDTAALDSAEAATVVSQMTFDLPQPADRGKPADITQLPRPGASDRIAKPILIVAVVMFVGLALLLLTARLVVRRRVQRAGAQN